GAGGGSPRRSLDTVSPPERAGGGRGRLGRAGRFAGLGRHRPGRADSHFIRGCGGPSDGRCHARPPPPSAGRRRRRGLERAAVLGPVGLIVVRLAPAAAVRLSRVGVAGPASQAELGARVDAGHGLLAALVLGAAVAMSAACAYLALFGGWYERGLAAAIAIA